MRFFAPGVFAFFNVEINLFIQSVFIQAFFASLDETFLVSSQTYIDYKLFCIECTKSFNFIVSYFNN